MGAEFSYFQNYWLLLVHTTMESNNAQLFSLTKVLIYYYALKLETEVQSVHAVSALRMYGYFKLPSTTSYIVWLCACVISTSCT